MGATSRVCRALWCLCMVSFGGCASLRYGFGEPPAVITAFAAADTLFAQGRYEQAIRTYAEFIGAYPASSYVDAAYLRIAHIYLYRPDSTRGWPGWAGADYLAARDTLVTFLRHRPETERRVEAENWVKLLDAAIPRLEARDQARDSAAPVLTEQEGTGATLRHLEGDRQHLRQAIRRCEAERDSLTTANRALSDELAPLVSERARLREETDRMRRMLIELERHKAEGE